MRQIVTTPEEAMLIEKEFRVVKKSIDARQRRLRVILTILEPHDEIPPVSDLTKSLSHPFSDSLRDSVVIVGSGPAGLFAALTLLSKGIKPIIIERGKPVSDRKKDIAVLNRNEGLDTDSNYCFGEGGAGTFSDGKLFSRSKKKGDMQQVMEIFHAFGASGKVLYETHAHIGSDKLPTIISKMREFILAHGGEFHFDTTWAMDDTVPTILAIGHSAHDTYRLLARNGVAMEAKGCAMGVRVEHPQHLINDIFYHHPTEDIIRLVGNASYSLITQVQGQGVYSFCMCPGGHIVPASSGLQQGVVNGMSASHRNSPYANSGMVVALPMQGDALEALAYQEALEHEAWVQANAHTSHNTEYRPAQRLQDFVQGKESSTLPSCSYLPGIVPSRLDKWLPEEIGSRLRQGLQYFGVQYKGYVTNDAVVVGVESRTSSPIRILRDKESYQSISHPWLYPCGEGAGYAGGITSSALDGIHAAEAVIRNLH